MWPMMQNSQLHIELKILLSKLSCPGVGRAFGTFHMQLAIRVLQCYVPKARPYTRAILALISG